MIALIERFFDVDGGRILIDGQNIAEVKVASLRDHIALVSQDTVLFHDTIRENIRFGRPDASDAEVEQRRPRTPWPTISSWRPRTATTPRSATTPCSSPAASASASPSPAPCCATRRIILLDEATSALDTESEHQVQLAFERLSQGRTTIVIAHRLSTVLGADKICVMVDGTIVEEGRHSELLALGKHYARLYHLQFERHKPAADSRRRQDETEASERSDRRPGGIGGIPAMLRHGAATTAASCVPDRQRIRLRLGQCRRPAGRARAHHPRRPRGLPSRPRDHGRDRRQEPLLRRGRRARPARPRAAQHQVRPLRRRRPSRQAGLSAERRQGAGTAFRPAAPASSPTSTPR